MINKPCLAFPSCRNRVPSCLYHFAEMNVRMAAHGKPTCYSYYSPETLGADDDHAIQASNAILMQNRQYQERQIRVREHWRTIRAK